MPKSCDRSRTLNRRTNRDAGIRPDRNYRASDFSSSQLLGIDTERFQKLRDEFFRLHATGRLREGVFDVRTQIANEVQLDVSRIGVQGLLCASANDKSLLRVQPSDTWRLVL